MAQFLLHDLTLQKTKTKNPHTQNLLFQIDIYLTDNLDLFD